MAEVAGLYGAIYHGAGVYGTDISFNTTADTITKLSGGFSAAFTDGDSVIVSGSTSNDGTYTVTVTSDTILTSGSNLTTEIAGDPVLIYDAAPGTVMLSFYNWTLDMGADVYDKTNFGSSGAREFVSGLANWTATAEKYWRADEDQNTWLGTLKYVRFFTKYAASPTGGNPAYYYGGLALVTGVSPSVPVDSLITQTITFQGVASLGSLTTKTSSW
jgi:hypothetical protein